LVKAEQALEAYHKRQADPQLLAELEGSFMSMVQTGFVSLGEFDRDERKRINDLLGFDGHIVFPTTSFDQIQGATQPAAFAVSVEALNRGLHYFCETDKRILPAPYLPFRFESKDPLDHVASVIKQDFSMIMIDRVAPAVARAFTQPDFDPAWARIQDAELAVTIHVGTDGGWDPVPLSFYNNGGSVPAHQEANIPHDALACMSIQYNAELFLAAMVFDDAFERFPRLRVAVVELGASWIISWTKRLDQSFRALRRLQDLSQVKM
jgi:hypothetical protein